MVPEEIKFEDLFIERGELNELETMQLHVQAVIAEINFATKELDALLHRARYYTEPLRYDDVERITLLLKKAARDFA